MTAKKKWTPKQWQKTLKVIENNPDCQSLIHSKLRSVGSYSGPRGKRKGDYRYTGDYSDVIGEILLALSRFIPPLSDAHIIAIAKNAVKDYFRSGAGHDYNVTHESQYGEYSIGETGGHYQSDMHKSEREESNYNPYSGATGQQVALCWNSSSQLAELKEWCRENYEAIANLLLHIIDDLWKAGKLGRSSNTPNVLKFIFLNKNANQTEIAKLVDISQQSVSQKIHEYMPVVSKAFLEHPEGKRLIKHRDRHLKYYDDEAGKINVTPDYSYQIRAGKCSVSIPFDGKRNNRLYIYWPSNGVYDLDTYPKNRGPNCDNKVYDLYNRLKRHALKRELNKPDKKPSLYIRHLAGEDWLNDYINMDKQFKISSIYFNLYNLILSESNNENRSLLDKIEISEPTQYIASGGNLFSYVSILLGQLACAPAGAFRACKYKSTQRPRGEFTTINEYYQILTEGGRNQEFLIEQYHRTPGSHKYLSYQQMNDLLNPKPNKIYTPPAVPTAPAKFLRHIEKLFDEKHGTRLSPKSIEYIAHPDRFRERQAIKRRWRERAEAVWSAHYEYMEATEQPRQYHGLNGLPADHKLPILPPTPPRHSLMEHRVDIQRARSKIFLRKFPPIPEGALQILNTLYNNGLHYVANIQQAEPEPACIPV